MGRDVPCASSIQVFQGCSFLVDLSVIMWPNRLPLEAEVILNLRLASRRDVDYWSATSEILFFRFLLNE